LTVVLSLRCADGVVIAADTQITESSQGMSYPGRKLHALGDYGAWGGSGARAVQLDLHGTFAEEAESIREADDVGRAIQQRVLPVLRYHYEHYIDEVPGMETAGGPSAYVLAAGYTDAGPFIVEINPNGMVSRYEDIGFHAVGSGAPMAHQAGSLLAHLQMDDRGVEYGVVGVVRVIDALAQTSPSVGGELDVYRITPDGAHELTDEEVEQARAHSRRWTQLEQEALDRLFS
jgi:proteasome beta subunit